MAKYQIPKLAKPPKAKKKQVLLVSSGDLRQSANQICWAAQREMEDTLGKAVAEAGYELVRAHPYKPQERHGFIGSQKEGMRVFAGIETQTETVGPITAVAKRYERVVAQPPEPQHQQRIGNPG